MSYRKKGKIDSFAVFFAVIGGISCLWEPVGFCTAPSQVCLGAVKGDSVGERAERRGGQELGGGASLLRSDSANLKRGNATHRERTAFISSRALACFVF